jgi:hypothetical protein
MLMYMDDKPSMRKEIRERTAGYIGTALGLVAGLAWNDAIKALIETLFPSPQNNILAKFGYAIVITIIVVMLTIYLVRFLSGTEKKN